MFIDKSPRLDHVKIEQMVSNVNRNRPASGQPSKLAKIEDNFLVDTILDTVAPARRAGRRPYFPLDSKRQVVEVTFQPGASVSLIASEHDVSANLVVARYDYNFAAIGVPGLTFMTRYLTGDNIDLGSNSPLAKIERDTDIGYVVQRPLKNCRGVVAQQRNGRTTLLKTT